MPRRSLVVAVLLGSVLLAGCAAGEDGDTAAGPSSSPTTSAVPGLSPSPSPSPSPAAVRVITAAFAGGKVAVDSPRVETTLGEKVVLRISSDVTEEIHVHGYDVYADVPAGGTVDIPLTLTLPGSYEVELHEAGRPLLQLRTA